MPCSWVPTNGAMADRAETQTLTAPRLAVLPAKHIGTGKVMRTPFVLRLPPNEFQAETILGNGDHLSGRGGDSDEQRNGLAIIALFFDPALSEKWQ